MNTKKILIGIGTVLGLGLVAYLLYGALTHPPNGASEDRHEVLQEFSRAVPHGMKEFHHNFYHFSILYPDSLTLTQSYDGGSATTFIFENTDEAKGFQIFVLPYGKDQISDTRLKKDLPLGVRNDLKDITIDGVLGASFNGKNLRLGETHEIWFIHDGYLFEVTTIYPLASWLDEIMTTWQFFDYKNQAVSGI